MNKHIILIPLTLSFLACSSTPQKPATLDELKTQCKGVHLEPCETPLNQCVASTALQHLVDGEVLPAIAVQCVPKDTQCRAAIIEEFFTCVTELEGLNFNEAEFDKCATNWSRCRVASMANGNLELFKQCDDLSIQCMKTTISE
jgi:hypothetical protein